MTVEIGGGKITTKPVIFEMVIGAVTTAPTKGTIVSEQASWYRDGRFMHMRYDLRQSSAGSGGSGAYLFPIPDGKEIDTDFLPIPDVNNNDSTTSVCGVAAGQISGPARKWGYAQPHSATQLRLILANEGTAMAVVSNTNCSLGSVNTMLSFDVKIPILGWS